MTPSGGSDTTRTERKAPSPAALYAVTDRLEPAIRRVEQAERRLCELTSGWNEDVVDGGGHIKTIGHSVSMEFEDDVELDEAKAQLHALVDREREQARLSVPGRDWSGAKR